MSAGQDVCDACGRPAAELLDDEADVLECWRCQDLRDLMSPPIKSCLFCDELVDANILTTPQWCRFLAGSPWIRRQEWRECSR
jgi:hypothetical protein